MSPTLIRKYLYWFLLDGALLCMLTFGLSTRNAVTKLSLSSSSTATKSIQSTRYQVLASQSPSSVEKVSLVAWRPLNTGKVFLPKPMTNTQRLSPSPSALANHPWQGSSVSSPVNGARTWPTNQYDSNKARSSNNADQVAPDETSSSPSQVHIDPSQKSSSPYPDPAALEKMLKQVNANWPGNNDSSNERAVSKLRLVHPR